MSSKQPHPSRDTIITNIALLSKLEYESFRDDFETQEMLIDHLVESFTSIEFTKDEIALFGPSREDLDKHIKMIIPMIVDRIWDRHIDTKASKRKGKFENNVTSRKQTKLSMTRLEKPPADLEYDMQKYTYGFQMVNWIDYSSVGSFGIENKDTGVSTFLLSNPQEDVMLGWCFATHSMLAPTTRNSSKKKVLVNSLENHQLTSSSIDRVREQFEKSGTEVIELEHGLTVYEDDDHFMSVHTGIGYGNSNYGVSTAFILFDKRNKEQIARCLVGYDITRNSIRDWHLEKKRGPMIDLYEVSPVYGGKGYGSRFFDYIVDYYKSNYKVDWIYAVGILGSATTFWKNKIGMTRFKNGDVRTMILKI